jgi:hypothetical protein
MKKYLLSLFLAFASFAAFTQTTNHNVMFQHMFEGWEEENFVAFEKNGGKKVFGSFGTKSSPKADFQTIITFKGDFSNEKLWEIELYVLMIRDTGLEVTQITPNPEGRKIINVNNEVYTQVDFTLTTTGDNNGYSHYNTVYYTVEWVGDKDITIPWEKHRFLVSRLKSIQKR